MGYHGSFSSWADVQSQFGISRVEPDEVIWANYDQDGYEGSADVLFRERGQFVYVHGSHCSCYGLSDDQWTPELYTAETLKALVEKSKWGFFVEQKDLIMAAIEKYASPFADLANEYGQVQGQLLQARKDLEEGKARVDYLEGRETELRAQLKDMLN